MCSSSRLARGRHPARRQDRPGSHGQGHPGGQLDLAFQRFRTDGTPDPTFAAGGHVLINMGFLVRDGGRIQHGETATGQDPDRDPIQQTDMLSGLAMQPDGKILAGGTTFGPPDTGDAFSLVRLLPDGSLDKTFGDRGRITTTFPGPTYSMRYTPSHCRAFDPRHMGPGAGSPWPDVASRGCEVTTSPWPSTTPTAASTRPSAKAAASHSMSGRSGREQAQTQIERKRVAFTPDGSLLVTGSTLDSQTRMRLALLRFDRSGRLDPAFGDGGMAMDGFRLSGRGRTLALQADGKILVGGRTYRDATGARIYMTDDRNRGDLFLAPFSGDGNPDSSFADGGIRMTDLGEEDELDLAPLRRRIDPRRGPRHREICGFKTSLLLMAYRPR